MLQEYFKGKISVGNISNLVMFEELIANCPTVCLHSQRSQRRDRIRMLMMLTWRLQRPVVKLVSRWGVQQDSGLWGEALARQLHGPPSCAPV